MSLIRSAEITTILFTDVVQSTEVLEQIGDEHAWTIFRDHHRFLGDAVRAAGGEELQWLGDGLMAAFASVGNAVQCAIAMQRAAREHTGEKELRIRVGLNSGEILRDDEGNGYFGIPVVTARRLCDRAEPGSILCSSTVAGLLAGQQTYRFRDLGRMALKGIAEPVHAYEALLGDAASETQPPIHRRPASAAPGDLPLPPLFARAERFAFAGRHRELDMLTALWREAAAGTKRVALIEGEPGIGKTRLAAEAARAVHEAGGTVLFGRCDEEMGVPFQPFVEALEHFLAHSMDARLRERLGRHPGELARLAPDLVYRIPRLPPRLRSDPETERYRLFDAIASWLAAASSARPMILVLDDLHWAGKPTLFLLRHVARNTDPARLLIVCTHRDTEVDRMHPLADLLADLRPVPGVERLILSGLDEKGVVEFMERVAGQLLDEAGRTLARAVHAETSGNPFFVGEVLRHLAESGTIEQRDGRWVSDRNVADIGIPAAVRDVVLRRVGRLSVVATEALTLASVIGRHFDLATLSAIGTFDEGNLVAALEEAARADLIEETDVDSWRFAHAIVRAALHQELSASRRARLHRRVAEAIESRHPDDLTALAYHFTEAGPALLQKAIDYTIEAGDQARTQLAHHQAVDFYERALTMLTAAQRRDHSRQCELLIRLGTAQKHAGELAHRETLLEAARLASRLGETDQLVRAALINNRGWASASGIVDVERVAVLEAALAAVEEEDSPSRAMLMATLAAELLFGGDRPRRVAVSDAALAMARRLGDPTILAHVLNVRSHVIWAPETLAERLANTAEHVAVVQQLSDPVARWYASATRPQACMEAGDIDEVDRHLAILSELTEDLGQPHLRWAATIDFAWRAHLRGHLAEAEKLAAAAYDIGAACGQPDALVYYAAQMIAIRWDQGRLGEMIPMLEQVVAQNPGIPAFRATLALAYSEDDRLDDARPLLEAGYAARFNDVPLDYTWLTAMMHFAEVAARLRLPEPAQVLYEHLAPWPDHVAFTGTSTFGSVSRSLGLLATTFGELDAADRHFARAAATHERLGAAALLARTRLDWALALRARGDKDDAAQAEQLLRAALRSAQDLELPAIARRAAALLAP